jgi:hypothetical protein
MVYWMFMFKCGWLADDLDNLPQRLRDVVFAPLSYRWLGVRLLREFDSLAHPVDGGSTVRATQQEQVRKGATPPLLRRRGRASLAPFLTVLKVVKIQIVPLLG